MPIRRSFEEAKRAALVARRNILAGVCGGCGGVSSIPAQSTPAIRRKSLSYKLTPQTDAGLKLIMRDNGCSKTRAALAVIDRIESDLVNGDNLTHLDTL